MVTRRPSSAQYKKTPRKAQSGVSGARTSRVSNSSPTPRTRSASDMRRTFRTERGEITHILPGTLASDNHGEYANRMSQQAFIERSVASGRRRKIVAALFSGVLAVIVAGAAAWFVFMNGIDSRLKIEDRALASVLADAPEEGAVYSVLAASFDDGDGGSGPDVAFLVRTDAAASSVSMVAVPGNVRIELSDGKVHRLGEAQAVGGDAEVVSAIESLSGVQVSHYVKTDAAGFSSLVDAVGGVEVNLPDSVRDSDAGSTVLPAGVQVLNGEQALFLCRADDYATSAEQRRGMNGASVVRALFKGVANADKLDFYREMDNLANYLQTDMGVRAVYEMLSSLKGVSADSIMAGVMPTHIAKKDDSVYQVPIVDEWNDMLGRFESGQAPQEDKDSIIGSVDSKSFTVAVNNGGSVVGAATDAAALLEGAGFKIDSVGNANQAVYNETLVVYQKDEDEAKAEALVATLGMGRPVFDAVNYEFDTDILVVIGNDWQTAFDVRDRVAS